MTIFESATWFGVLLALVLTVLRAWQPVPVLGNIIMYRRGGGDESVVMPSPGECRTTTRAREPFFDGVVVPSSRGADSLLRAARTARNAGAPLVVLASGQTDVAEVERLLQDKNSRLVLDSTAYAREPELRTFRHPYASTISDVSRKRNVGLVIARMLGWRTVLFVDDDVQEIPRQTLSYAADLLAGADRGGTQRQLVGWTFEEFRDFSTVGHACSYGVDARVSFIGGGAMAMRCDVLPPFFPPVYNEDLLVELELLRGDPDSVCVVGTLEQDAYSPFGDPARAASQEFGEVLTEGWSRKSDPTDVHRPEFWELVLRDRRSLLLDSVKDLAERGVIDGVRALHAALAMHRDDWPRLLADFVSDWMRDMASWRDFLNSLEKDDGLFRSGHVSNSPVGAFSP